MKVNIDISKLTVRIQDNHLPKFSATVRANRTKTTGKSSRGDLSLTWWLEQTRTVTITMAIGSSTIICRDLFAICHCGFSLQ
jgi:hypothetical protein